MEIIIGLIIIAIGSFGQSSSYVPINKVKDWSWESFWLVQGIFAWLVFPFLGAQLAIPNGSSLLELWRAGGAAGAVIYGILWGIGGLTFGLSMRYLGVALGQSIALGTCAGFGTLFPAVFGGTDLFHGDGLVLLIGVCITLAGIAVIGYAGSLRARNMTEEEKKAAEETANENKDLFEEIKKALNGKVKEVKVNPTLQEHPVTLSSEGGISMEMEKVLRKMPGSGDVESTKVLELNPNHTVFAALKAAHEAGDTAKVDQYAELLYDQSLLIAGLPIEDPVAYAQLVCGLMK